MRKANGTLLAAGALALTMACGGAGEPDEEIAPVESEPVAPSVDACQLLTAGEIEQALGAAPGEATPGSEELGACSWPSASEPDEALVRVAVREARLDSYEDFIATYLRDFGEEPSRERHREVSGIGDWAMFEEDDRALLVYVGDRVLEVGVGPAGGEEQARALAEAALPRLP